MFINNLQQRDIQSIWHPFTQMKLNGNAIPIVKASGIYLYDEQGNAYIDAISSWWVNTHGHAHHYIAQKVFEQLQTLEHVMFAGFTHLPAITLAERLLKLLPPDHTKIFYSDNGSTAVEVAIKMAFQYWHNQQKEKYDVIAFHQSYHGDTFGAMSVSQRSAYTHPFNQNLFDVSFIDAPALVSSEKVIEQLQNTIQQKKVSAFIFEPLVQGAEGMLMYDASVLDTLIKICKAHDIICIADEVMTGFARTGRMFASDYLQNKPDIICMSKGITGGTMALGATSCTEKIYAAFYSDDRLKTFFHGHSYTANPVACAAANASLDIFQEDATCNGIAMIRNMHESFVQQLKKYSFAGNPRSTGTILAFDYLNNHDTGYFNPERDDIYAYFLEKKIILRPLGNTIYIIPPYCIKAEELQYIYNAIEEFLSK